MSHHAPQFNIHQQRVVNFRKGYAVAMAAPGSGKTTVIIARIKALLAEGWNPAGILSLTFTKEGAKEMAKRAGLDNQEYVRSSGHKHKPFSTFHSWCLAFINAEANALPFPVHKNFYGQPAPLCLPLDAARTLAQICRRLPKVDWKEAGSFISKMKRMGLTPAGAAQYINEGAPIADDFSYDKQNYFVTAYEKYDVALRLKGLLDFDSIIVETANLLESRPDVRKRWQYQQVQIDEAQDTDAVQWRIVKSITEGFQNALAVGDENQGMYSWRGSESNLTEYFTKVFPSAIVMPLPINYRSTQSIVQYCKEIAPIQNETVTGLSTPNEQGAAIDYRLYPYEADEAKNVINCCTDMGNTAIIARTNKQLAAFEDECSQRQLRYKLLGKSGFWTQQEVRDCVSLLGAVVMPSDNNVLQLLKTRCDMTKYLRKDTHEHPGTVKALLEFQKHNPGPDGQVLLHRLMQRFTCEDSAQDDCIRNIGHALHGLRSETGNLKPRDAMHRIVERFGLLSFYDVKEDEDGNKDFDNDPLENILKVVEYAEKHGSLSKFYDHTQRVRRAQLARTNCLILSTIHQAKGKEWKNVFVVGVQDGMLPHAKGDELEEKRIYFVACSRAAKKLVVSAAGVPSIFIQDKIPKDPNGNFIPLDSKDAQWEGFQLKA